jgi:hypothetical protein
MKSITNLGSQPRTIPLLADDILEFHAARLLLLLNVCGKEGVIDSLTKMAKLDFFVRYPKFFNELCEYLGEIPVKTNHSMGSAMIRYRYGPWDQRYYHVLGYLEARGLIEVQKQGKAFQIMLTSQGKEISNVLEQDTNFEPLLEHMASVKKILGKYRGTAIKDLIYQIFEKQIAQLPLGEVIE